jgi:16S rRNA (cytidine1402-2'-O)-methyltransferase
LLSILSIEKHPSSIVAVHEHNERDKSADIIERIESGQSVAYASDAGMPAISDPGAVLVDAAHRAGVIVTVVPGPSAVVSAVAASGFVTPTFVFAGFVPRSGKVRREFFDRIVTAHDITVAYESPQRISATLHELAQLVGPGREVVVCRELTKKFEEIVRGSATYIAAHFDSAPKGECVIVVDALARSIETSIDDDDNLRHAMEVLVNASVSSKDSVEILASLTSYSKNDIKNLYAVIRDAQK